MKKTLLVTVTALALVAAIVIVKCSGSSTKRSAVARSDHGTAAASARARARDVHVDPRTQARGSIAGTVTDEAKAPVAGARVCADPHSRAVSPQALREPLCAQTDAAGHYSLANLIAAEYVVTASAKAFRPAVHLPVDQESPRFSLASGEARTGIDLVLKAGGVEIHGTVSDVTGGPVANALVTARRDWNGGSVPPVETDAQGAFSLWVAPGSVEVRASAEGYASGADQGRAPGTFEILLTPESSLAGTVVDAVSGAPVPGVTVEVEGTEWSGSDERDGRDITDEKGTFRVSRLAPGRHVVTAISPHGFGRDEGSTLVGLGQHVDGVVVRLHPAYRITGRIVGPDKATCKEPWLSLVDKERERRVLARHEPGGEVFADGILPGTYHVNARCKGFQARDSYPLITVVDKDVVDQVWDVDGGATIKGRVVDKRGQPIAGVEIWADSIGGAARSRGSWGSDTSKDDGTYEIAGLRPGSFKVEVQSDSGIGPAGGWPVEVAAGSPTVKDLVLDAGGRIAGSVVDSQGTPVASVTVRVQALVTSADWRGNWMTETASDGSFTVDNVRGGDYRVLAMRDWSTQLRKPGTTDDSRQGETAGVTAGKTTTVKLVVEAQTGVIKGSVVDASGAPAPDAYVDAARESDAAGAQQTKVLQTRWTWGNKPVITAVDGTFTITGLSAGNYTVRAHRKGGGEAIAEHVAVGTTAKLQIRPTGTIAGIVKSASGAIDEMTIELRDPKTGFLRNERLFRTGGRFTLADLPAGSFTLTVSSSRGKKQVPVELAEGEQKTGIDVTLERLVTITGRVVDMVTKQPVPGMRMMIGIGKDGRGGFSRSFDAEQRNVSGSDGRFTLLDAPAGAVVIRGFPKDYPETEYPNGLQVPKLVEGTGTIDIGDLPVLKRRTRPGDKVGELGVRWAETAPGTALDARTLEVSYIEPGGPAAKTDLKVGDAVTAIDGIDVKGANHQHASTLLRAPPGTKLVLALQRGGSVEIVLAAP